MAIRRKNIITRDKQIGFWHQRAVHYDKLFWTKDKCYVSAIINTAKFQKSDLILDIGIGTGAFAKNIKPHVGHIIGIDISESMLKKGRWHGISAVRWDIRDALFANDIFDKVLARMCFHHILNGLDRAVRRCRDLLKKGGKIIVAEGLPPSEDLEVFNWYTEMFKLKEERLVFSEKALKELFLDNSFKNVSTKIHIMESFSIKNWLINAGISKKNQIKIMNLHRRANAKIKKAYNMYCTKDDCLVDTKNLILVAEK